MTRIWTANTATIAHRCRKFNSRRRPSCPPARGTAAIPAASTPNISISASVSAVFSSIGQ